MTFDSRKTATHSLTTPQLPTGTTAVLEQLCQADRTGWSRLVDSPSQKTTRDAVIELETLRADQMRHAPDPNVEKMVTGSEGRFERLVADFERAVIERHGEKGRQEI